MKRVLLPEESMMPLDTRTADRILGPRRKHISPPAQARFEEWPLWQKYRRWYDHIKGPKE